MVDVPVNPDIAAYKNIVVAGLTAKETISGIVCILTGGTLLTISRVFGIPTSVSIVTMVPILAVLVLILNYNKDDLNFIEIVKSGRYKKQKTFISYESTESYEAYSQIPVSLEDEEVDEEAEFNKLLKKIIIGGITLFFALIAVVVMIIIN